MIVSNDEVWTECFDHGVPVEFCSMVAGCAVDEVFAAGGEGIFVPLELRE